MVGKILKTILLLLVVIFFVGKYTEQKMEGSKSSSPVEKRFTIESGEGVNQISERLEEQSLISDNVFFDLYIWKDKREGKIVTGTYVLRPNMTIPEIVDIITSGKAEPQDLKITIIEGWNSQQIGEYLAENNIVSKEEFQKEVKNLVKYQAKHSFLSSLDPQKDTLEGFLFPDTYLIYPNSTAEMITEKMLVNFALKTNESLLADVGKSGHSLLEVITLASIIEREAPHKEDQKIVSGIFWNRLSIGHPLQSCATINYILGTNKKRLSLEDTRIESPYNTYLNKGLPPGPIANPGLSAITAAIYPKDSDYFYFQNNDEGELIYSVTLEDHNKEKNEVKEEAN